MSTTVSTTSDSTAPLSILVVVASLSGNTRELARQIAARCRTAGHAVQWQEADDPRVHGVTHVQAADLVLLGSWTDNAGRTPAEMKAWVAAHAQHRARLGQVAVFGTGETQWGEQYYCGAVHRLARYFASRYPVLEVEQMPHGPHHAEAIDAWTRCVLATCAGSRDADS